MRDIYEELADAVLAIRADEKLIECFNRLLQFDLNTQQEQVAKLLHELEKLNAPSEVTNFVRLLGNAKLAQQVLELINS